MQTASRANKPNGDLMNQATLALIAMAAAALLSSCTTTPASQAAANQRAAAHVAAATQAAGSDMQALTVLCKPTPAVRASHAEVERGVANQIARPAPPPGQAFDNLYFVGAAWVSAWALKTSDGIILIDALNNAQEASTLIEGGMHRLGLNPADIKYIIVTYAHGDHYGGVNYLVQRYHPRVVMSEADWAMTEGKLEFESSQWGPVPKRDIAAKDGDVITLGDAQVTLYVTPGHTAGTLSPVFDVKSAGDAHRALLWGGTAFNFGKDLPRLDSYIDATNRMKRIVDQRHIDVMLSNHSGYDGTIPKLARMAGQAPAQDNPFVLGTPAVERSLTVMNECAQATRERFGA
jgi:metallo-beta-lactamase class B